MLFTSTYSSPRVLHTHPTLEERSDRKFCADSMELDAEIISPSSSPKIRIGSRDLSICCLRLLRGGSSALSRSHISGSWNHSASRSNNARISGSLGGTNNAPSRRKFRMYLLLFFGEGQSTRLRDDDVSPEQLSIPVDEVRAIRCSLYAICSFFAFCEKCGQRPCR